MTTISFIMNTHKKKTIENAKEELKQRTNERTAV